MKDRDPHLRRDIAHTLAVAILACLLSGGLVYLFYLARVLRTALDVREAPSQGACLLLFGKRLVHGLPDGDFQARIVAVHRSLLADPTCQAILLGGGPTGESEAEAAARLLQSLHPPIGNRLWLEAQSQNTLENLRNARQMLSAMGKPRLLLVSNRYHLARCAQFARQLGLVAELHPAEDRLVWRVSTIVALTREAFCLCWLDLGTRWARLIGHERMQRRVS